MASWAERGRSALLAATLASAAFAAPAQHVVVEPYQDDVGLTSMAVRCLAQGVDGAMWVCTENGLFRFDGFRMRPEQLPADLGSDVSEVLADRQGRLWVAIDNHLFLRRAIDGTASWSAVVRPDGSPMQVDGRQRFAVDDQGVLFAMDYDSHLWSISAPGSGSRPLVATRVALPPFDPYRGGVEAAGGPVLAVGLDLWFACGSGMCLWRDGQLHTWGPAQGLPRGMWASVLRARDGSLWARSSDHLARLGPGATRFETVEAPPAKVWPAAIAMVEDRAGAIVTATDDGLARWDGHAWRQWTPHEGLPETAVRALLVDTDGELWMGNAGRGVHRWAGYGVVEHWTQASGLPSPVVWSFARDGTGRLCAATSRGVACLDEASHQFRDVAPAFPHTISTRLAADTDGDLWWVQDGRVLTLRPGEQQARLAFRDDSLAYVVQGSDAIYLVGANGAERLVASRAGARRQAMAKGMPHSITLNEVVSDGASEWFLVNGGAYRNDGGRWLPLVDEHGTVLEVRGLAAFAGASEFWVVVPSGIAIYTVDNGMARLSRRIDAANIGGADVQFLRIDGDHRAWIGTDQGVFVFERGLWSHLDRDSGLPWNDIDEHAFLLDSDGTAWIGTSAGAVRLVAGGLRPAPSPVLRLEEFQVGNRVLHAVPTSPVALSERHVRVTLGTRSLGRGRSMRLEYRLHGDAPWQSFEGNVLRLEALDPAFHHLQIRAAARLPIDQPGPSLEMAFTIEPPWWTSMPARLGYAVSLALLWTASIVILRRRNASAQVALERAIADRTFELERSREAVRMLGVHNARSLEEERTRVSRELHDEMGQQLAALRMEVAVLGKHLHAGQPPGQDALAMLLSRVDSVVASMRGVVAQLRPPALDGGLATAINWLAAEFTRHTGVPVQAQLDACARSLPPDAATMVFRIAQESLNNVRRHAQATQVTLRLCQENGDCELLIKDDGRGFDSHRHRSGYGLLGIEERARALGGTVSVESVPGAGTTVRLRMRSNVQALA